MNPAALGPLFIPLFVLIGFLVHLGVTRRPRTRERVLTIGLLWGLGMGMGFGELLTAAPHLVAPTFAAQQIGFPAGNPFQWEVAWANLAFAALGLLCLKVRSTDYWLAAITGYLVYFWGCGIGHIREYVVDDNTAPYNWGPIIPVVFVMPVVLLGLVLALRAVQRREHGSHEEARDTVPAPV